MAGMTQKISKMVLTSFRVPLEVGTAKKSGKRKKSTINKTKKLARYCNSSRISIQKSYLTLYKLSIGV